MRVMCIGNKPFRPTPYNDSLKRLVVFKIYNVLQSDGDGYLLKEVKSTAPCGMFHQSHFIPLSDIDETEFERHYEKPTVDYPYDTIKSDLLTHQIEKYSRLLDESRENENWAAVSFLKTELYNLKKTI